MDKVKNRRHTARGVLVTALAFLLLVAALWLGLSQLNTRSDREQAAVLREAVRRATVLCYAVEGRYPASVEELCRNYGLTYDRERFIVTLDAFASNLLPDIRVLSVGGAEYE